MALPVNDPVDRHRAVVAGTISRQFWRAATFMLCAALIAMAYFVADSSGRQHELTRMFLHDNTNAQIEQLIGPTFKEYLFDGSATFIVLLPVDAEASFKAVVCLRETDAGQGMLVIDGLPWNEGYELRIRDANGGVHRIATFASLQRLGGHEFQVPQAIAVASGLTWEIVHGGDVLMRSA